MFKLITFLLGSFLITMFLNFVFGEKKSEVTEGKEIVYKVTAEKGIVGCLSKEKFKEAANYYSAQNFQAIEKMLSDEVCFIFKKGDELRANENTCSDANLDDELFAFKSDKFMVVQPYLPCFAVR